MSDLPESMPGGVRVAWTLVEWGGLLLLSILLVTAWNVRRHVLHPIRFVKAHKRAMIVLAGLLVFLIVGTPFLTFTADLSFQTTQQENNGSTGSTSTSSSQGLLPARFVPWRRVGVIVSGTHHRELSRAVAAAVADRLRESGRIEYVDVIEGAVEIEPPEDAFDALLAIRTSDFSHSDRWYWKRAEAWVEMESLGPRWRTLDAGLNDIQLGFEGSVRHKSRTTGLCSSRKHLEIVAEGISGQLAGGLLSKLEEVDR